MTETENKKKVLIVDDTRTNITILMEALKVEYKLAVATNGQKALEYVAKNPPDLILLDIIMPEMDGYEVCRQLKVRERTGQIPIIFLTALSEVKEKAKGFELGAVDYITKPFEIVEVKARVRTHLQLEEYRRDLKLQNLELVKARTQLEYQVKELEGRDRLVRFQMTGSSLEEAYREILQVVKQVLKIPRSILYCPDEAGQFLVPQVNLGWESGRVVESVAIDDVASKVAGAYRDTSVQKDVRGEAAVPILYHEDPLAILWVEGLEGATAEQQAALQILGRLTGEAALMIRSAQMMDELGGDNEEIAELLALSRDA